MTLRDYFQRNRHFIGYVVGFVGVFVGLWAVAELTLGVRDAQQRIRAQQLAAEVDRAQIQAEAELGLKTYRAVCTLRGDLIVRVRASVVFLASHPDGFAGIDAKTLETSIENQQKTIKSLQGLRCKGQSS